MKPDPKSPGDNGGEYAQDATLAHRGPTGEVVMSAGFQGPLPPPSWLREYNEVVPGLGDSLASGVAAELNHRHGMETRLVDAQVARWNREGDEHRRGQVFAFAISVLWFACSTAVAITGIIYQNTAGVAAGGTMGGVGITAIVTAFLVGRRVRQTSVPPTTTKR